jgi:4-azaleucine resistance transporter AzlC
MAGSSTAGSSTAEQRSPDEAPARLRDGLTAAAPLSVLVILFGLSFGVLASSAGMDGLAATVFSATTFAGAAQFAAISVLASGGTAIAAILTAALLNARYAPMSIAVAHLFRGSPPRRLVEGQLIVDESWALAGRGGTFRRPVLLGAGLLLYVLWVSSTAAGTIVGDRLGDPADYGVDAAFPALFVGLAIPYLRSRRNRLAAAAGALIVLALLPWAPAGLPLVAATAACLLGLRR